MRDVITKARVEQLAANGTRELTFSVGTILTQTAKSWIKDHGIVVRFVGEDVYPPEEEIAYLHGREKGQKRAIVTVLGLDKVGIIAAVSGVLASYGVNILDISQTVMQEFFAMTMIVNLINSKVEFTVLRDALDNQGEVMELKITLQNEDIFRFMHLV